MQVQALVPLALEQREPAPELRVLELRRPVRAPRQVPVWQRVPEQPLRVRQLQR